jgi:hypothetical protein
VSHDGKAYEVNKNKKFKRERNCEPKQKIRKKSVKQDGPEEGPCGCFFFLTPLLHNVHSHSVRCIPTRAFCSVCSRPLSLSDDWRAAASALGQVLRL